jgi:transposase-like protein
MSYMPVRLVAVAPCEGAVEQAMDVIELKQLLGSVARLTAKQKAELLKALSAAGQGAQVCSLVESRMAQLSVCPHCGGARIVRNGSASGLQRYKCRACQRTFNALSTTPLARLRMKAKWLQQQDVLLQGLSVHRAATALGVAPCTAFRWRHRFLQLAQPVKAPQLTGVVEADETFFLRSSKGQRPGRKARKRGGCASRKERGMDLMPVLVARDRSGATADFVLDAVSKDCLSQALKPRIHSDAILCTDGSAAMAAAAKDLRVQHEAMNLSAGERVRGPWHIQNANAYHGRLKGWIARFKGVATDYLESYLGWFRALDRASRSRSKAAPMLALALGLEGHP